MSNLAVLVGVLDNVMDHPLEGSGGSLSACGDSGLELFDLLVEVEAHFEADEGGHTLDGEGDELSLRVTDTVDVGEIDDVTTILVVNTALTAALETVLFAESLELLTAGAFVLAAETFDAESSISPLGEVAKANVGACADTGTGVGGAGEDVTVTVGQDVLVAGPLHGFFDFDKTGDEAHPDLLEITTTLHGDDTHVVLFGDPDEQIAVVVFPDTTSIGPVTSATGREEQGGVGVLEGVTRGEETTVGVEIHTLGKIPIADVGEICLGELRHGLGHELGVVGTGKIEFLSGHAELMKSAFEAGGVIGLTESAQGLDDDLFQSAALLELDGRGQGEALDGTAGTDTRGLDEHTLHEGVVDGGVDLDAGDGARKIGRVEVVTLGVPLVATEHHLVGEFLPNDGGVLIGEHETAGDDVRVAGVVDTGLGAFGESVTGGGLHFTVHFPEVAELLILEDVGHEIVVSKAGDVLRAGEPVVGSLSRHDAGIEESVDHVLALVIPAHEAVERLGADTGEDLGSVT